MTFWLELSSARKRLEDFELEVARLENGSKISGSKLGSARGLWARKLDKPRSSQAWTKLEQGLNQAWIMLKAEFSPKLQYLNFLCITLCTGCWEDILGLARLEQGLIQARTKLELSLNRAWTKLKSSLKQNLAQNCNFWTFRVILIVLAVDKTS